MIVPMQKYTFLVFYREYNDFLDKLQQLGVLHVIEKDFKATDEVKQKYEQIKRFEGVLQFLAKTEPSNDKEETQLKGTQILDEIESRQSELEEYELALEDMEKEMLKAKPWGDFSPDLINKLKNKGVQIRFLITSKKKFIEFEEQGLPVQLILEQGNNVYFILIQKGKEKNWYFFS